MSKDNYDFNDLDAILAEFRDGGTAEEAPVQEAEPVKPAPETEPAVEVYSSHAVDSPFSAPGSEDTVRYELPPIYSREEEKERKAAQKSRFRKAKPEPETAAGTEDPGESEEEAPKKKRRLGRKAQRRKAEKGTQAAARLCQKAHPLDTAGADDAGVPCGSAGRSGVDACVPAPGLRHAQRLLGRRREAAPVRQA